MEKTNELGITGYIIKADNTPFQIVEKVKEILAG
jgi:hypothetical protein